MFNRLLVPLDGSKLSERALPHAVLLSRIFHAQLVLLQVLDSSSAATSENPLIDPVSWKIRKAQSEMYLQSIVQRLHEQELEVEHHIVEGKSAETIVSFSQQENIDLLIIASHGQGGLSPWNISSVIQKVIHKVYLPILIVRAYHTAAEDDAPSYRKITIPLDSSKRAECSLPSAITIAEASQSRILLLTVLRRPDVPFSGPHTAELSQTADRYMELSRSSVTPYLDELSQRIPVTTDVRVVESDSVARSIHEVVEQEASDLVVFCAHGQTGHFDWPYGSIVYNFIEYGDCPVLIIQDIPPSRARPTHAEIAASKYGSR